MPANAPVAVALTTRPEEPITTFRVIVPDFPWPQFFTRPATEFMPFWTSERLSFALVVLVLLLLDDLLLLVELFFFVVPPIPVPSRSSSSLLAFFLDVELVEEEDFRELVELLFFVGVLLFDDDVELLELEDEDLKESLRNLRRKMLQRL